MFRAMLVSAIMVIVTSAVEPSVALAACPERPACSGCGCQGGPGYRGPDHKCVGYRNLDKVCGSPPTLHCTFENASGTGRNHDCALGLEESGQPIKED